MLIYPKRFMNMNSFGGKSHFPLSHLNPIERQNTEEKKWFMNAYAIRTNE